MVCLCSDLIDVFVEPALALPCINQTHELAESELGVQALVAAKNNGIACLFPSPQSSGGCALPSTGRHHCSKGAEKSDDP